VVRTVDQWHTLAPPKRPDQWVDGRSALECARAWCRDGSPAVPAELADLLASHRDTMGAVIRSVTPEQKVRFDESPGEPRNADIVAVAHHPAGAIAISIEAKADEPFDHLVHEEKQHYRPSPRVPPPRVPRPPALQANLRMPDPRWSRRHSAGLQRMLLQGKALRNAPPTRRCGAQEYRDVSQRRMRCQSWNRGTARSSRRPTSGRSASSDLGPQ
jgi:hypothetical protein